MLDWVLNRLLLQSTFRFTSDPDDPEKIGIGGIAGIVAGAIAFLVILGICSNILLDHPPKFRYCNRKRKGISIVIFSFCKKNIDKYTRIIKGLELLCCKIELPKRRRPLSY